MTDAATASLVTAIRVGAYEDGKADGAAEADARWQARMERVRALRAGCEDAPTLRSLALDDALAILEGRDGEEGR